ncbi:Methionine aminopeptidase 1, mitochondrial [Capillimicrobium parvum]|uniref:Methionine aminopeptidase 1, mitochondrial n=2 Tax=Capillimicrobium parvum TaxID=2884022 RepID=A0A9E6Y2Y8_9ACTN|nr:Methionine aminopeptidase 1, mitochondrial [Capillimicrobium parvum]
MDEAEIDVVLACSPHNVQYLLGGYRFFLFAHGTVMGVSRYLPIVGYVRGRPDRAFLIGNPLEAGQQELEPPWVVDVANAAWTSRQSAELAGRALAQRGLARARIAVEESFLPHDAHAALAAELPGAVLQDAFAVLEELRAVKRPDELVELREGAEAVVGSMRAVFGQARPGMTRAEVADLMRIEESRRGLSFEYCLVNTGPSYNRTPSAALRWEHGELCCLDSGGSRHGYVCDMARMGWMGDVPERARELLAQVAHVQEAARAVVAPGRRGGDILEAAHAAQRACANGGGMDFVAHGMGLVSHEVPRLTSTGVVSYPADHADRPLEAGMVLSIETDLRDPELGLIKLEDTVAVTPNGFEAFGDQGRDWNVTG